METTEKIVESYCRFVKKSDNFRIGRNEDGLKVGLTRRWRFSEKAVGSACGKVRFQVFRTVTFDTKQSFEIPESRRWQSDV